MGTWYLYESDGTTQITSTTEENLVYTFPQNPGSSDITYKVKYVDNGCIGELSGGIKQDGCTGCDPSEWGFSLSPTTTPAGDTLYQDQWVPVEFPQEGHKVWPFYIWKKINGTWTKQWERDNNSFTVKLYGPNGEDLSGKLTPEVRRPSGQEITEMIPYLLDVLITNACDLRGEALTITIAPEECEDAIGKITGHFGSTEAYTIVVQDTGGQPYDHKMEIGFMGYIAPADSVCPPTWIKMGDFTVSTGQTGGVTSGTGYLFIGLEVDYTAQQSDLWCRANDTIDHLPSDKHPLIVASLANTGGNQEPRAAIVLNVSNKIITIKYDKNYSGPTGPGTTCPNG